MTTPLCSNFKKIVPCLVLLSISALSPPSFSAANRAAVDPADYGRVPVESQVQVLKKEALALSQELKALEDEVLFPASSQVAVFLSVETGKHFKLSGMRLSIDDQLVASSIYDNSQREALERGAVQPLYLGNLRKGAHQVTAQLIGQDTEGRKYQRELSVAVVKRDEAGSLELKIVDSASKQPQIQVGRKWAL